MQREIILPQVELNMDNVTVVEWLVRPSDLVRAEQNILRVETQKAVVEVPSNATGYLRKKCVSEGETIREKSLLCILSDTPDEPIRDAVADATEQARLARAHTEGERAEVGGSHTSATSPPTAILAAPAARKLAKDLRIDLAGVKGTGPGGRITVENVQAAFESSKGKANEASPLSPARLALIGQMQKALREIPQIHVAREMDVSRLTSKSEGITFTHRLVQVTAAALVRHPALRTRLEEKRLRVEPVSVAVAMDTSRGLLAPVLRSANTMSLEDIAKTCRELSDRAEAGLLRREHLENAPFAISNLGMLGVDFFNAFVFHGQTAVLAVGRWCQTDQKGAQAWFSLAVDHRIVDGAEAARFLETLQRIIKNS